MVVLRSSLLLFLLFCASVAADEAENIWDPSKTTLIIIAAVVGGVAVAFIAVFISIFSYFRFKKPKEIDSSEKLEEGTQPQKKSGSKSNEGSQEEVKDPKGKKSQASKAEPQYFSKNAKIQPKIPAEKKKGIIKAYSTRMACPFAGGSNHVKFVDPNDDEDKAQAGINKVELGQGVTYSQYLQLDKLLDCQQLQSDKSGRRVDDEHLFIIIHQAYELWFKQIIFDIDIVRRHLNTTIVDETKTLKIVSGLERTVRILKLLVDQIIILDTMSPLDFVDFRKYLTPASGFQSLQFRLLENKLGVRHDRRIKYNAQHYKNVFLEKSENNALTASEEEPSLLKLVENWLERTPGLKQAEIEGEVEEGFWPKYERAVKRFLNDMYEEANAPGQTDRQREQGLAEYYKTKDSFATILDHKQHEQQILNGQRLLSHDAMKGALMIYFYRDMPRFSQPYQILTYLMDIDSLFTKWRYNHVILVQRMLGSKQGTGGSSGYMYLRSTVSDKYKVFLDLFNLSTWLIPREYIPSLSPRMVKTLSEHSHLDATMLSSYFADTI